MKYIHRIRGAALQVKTVFLVSPSGKLRTGQELKSYIIIHSSEYLTKSVTITTECWKYQCNFHHFRLVTSYKNVEQGRKKNALHPLLEIRAADYSK